MRQLIIPFAGVLVGSSVLHDPGFGQPPVEEPAPQVLLHFDDQDGKPVDASGAGQVIVNHEAAAGQPGKFGSAYQFDGQGAHVDAGDNYGITFAFPVQTIELWLNPATDGEESGVLSSQEKPTRGSWRWNLSRAANGTVVFSIWDGQQEPAKRELTSKSPAPAGEWIHVAATLDTGGPRQMRLFVNGRQEDSGPLTSVSPYGRLYVGTANAGFFAGRLDEVAIYDRVLSDAVIGRHASGRQPIRDGRGPAESRTGFYLVPVGGAATVAIRHTAFPGRSWRFRIPEYAYRDLTTDRGVHPSGVVWTRRDDASLRFRWDAPEDLKKKVRLDFWGRLAATPDGVTFELTGKNVGDKPWGEEPWGGVLSLFCFGAGANEGFHDYEATRTFVRKEGRWTTVHEIV
ncbi:MAG: LamG domain-containing protein, partial [Planctomycetota bacterium]